MSRDKLILLFGLVIYGMGQSLLFIVGVPLSRDVGLTESQFGLVVSASNLALAFSAPFWGKRSQISGRRYVYLLGLWSFAIGYGLVAIGFQAGLNGWLTATPLFATLLALRFVYGTFAGAINPAATAYIADTTDEASRAKGMAIIAMSGGLGTIVGPAFGAALSGISLVFPMYAVAILALAAIAVTLPGLPEPAQRAGPRENPPLSGVFGRALPYLVGWFVIFGFFTSVQLVTGYFIEDRLGITVEADVMKTSSFAFLCMAVATLVVQAGILPRWKAPPRMLLIVAFTAFALGLLMLAYGSGVAVLLAAYAVMGFSFGFAAPALNAAGSLSVGREEQGAVAGLLTAAPTVGMIFGPALGGFVYRIAPTLPMILGAIMSAAMVVWYLIAKVPDPRAD